MTIVCLNLLTSHASTNSPLTNFCLNLSPLNNLCYCSSTSRSVPVICCFDIHPQHQMQMIWHHRKGPTTIVKTTRIQMIMTQSTLLQQWLSGAMLRREFKTYLSLARTLNRGFPMKCLALYRRCLTPR